PELKTKLEVELDEPEDDSGLRLEPKRETEDILELKTETEADERAEVEMETDERAGAEVEEGTEMELEDDTLTVPDDFTLDISGNADENIKENTEKKAEKKETDLKKTQKTFQKTDSETLPVPAVKPTIPACTNTELALREKIRKTLRAYDHISLCTEENRPIDVISYIVPYGCDAEIYYGPRESNIRINAIGALCWNVPLGDESAFTDSTERLMPRLGYGIQQYSGQLLAALAIARVPIDYRFPAGWAVEADELAAKEKNGPENGKEPYKETRHKTGNKAEFTLENEDEFSLEIEEETISENENDSTDTLPRGQKRFGIQNLVDFEQKNCKWGRDHSLTLIALAYYLPTDAEWESSDGELWTLERLVQNELERPMAAGDSSATNQLLGLLCAIRCRQMRTKNVPLTGQYARADSYIKRFCTHVFDLQNEIGVWHPEFFKKKGMTPEKPTEMLIASGHILRWLVTATPRHQLNDPRILKSVTTVQELLDYQLTYWDPTNASGTEVEGIMTALHALTIYEKRRFKK
ncbi:MAG: hypothetical protein Q4C70_11840, partial [Planctomycetia bacterium]|nr:hypothetical protein [Planctomycetia bacterium]